MPAEKYFLKSERLGFRWWTKKDLPLAQELWGDLEVTKFFGGPFAEDEIARRLERELERARQHQFQYWPIHWLEDDDFAGCCGLRPFQLEEGILELGFHLRPKYWGRGLAGEAARVAIEYAFGTLGCKGLAAGHHPENVNSKKVLEKLGFRYTHDAVFPALGIEIPFYRLMRQS